MRDSISKIGDFKLTSRAGDGMDSKWLNNDRKAAVPTVLRRHVNNRII